MGVRDADLTEAGNQDLIFIFAAGNDGPGSGTFGGVGTPGNGKASENMITVGASEDDRASEPTWTDGCGVSSTGADNVMDVINFSSLRRRGHPLAIASSPK